MTKEQKDRVKQVVQAVYDEIVAEAWASEEELSRKLYSIQDFLGDINVSEEGIDFD